MMPPPFLSGEDSILEPLCFPESSDEGSRSSSLQCPSLELLVCLFCSESFPLLQQDLLLRHLLLEHKLVIADVKLITDLPKYECWHVSVLFKLFQLKVKPNSFSVTWKCFGVLSTGTYCTGRTGSCSSLFQISALWSRQTPQVHLVSSVSALTSQFGKRTEQPWILLLSCKCKIKQVIDQTLSVEMFWTIYCKFDHMSHLLMTCCWTCRETRRLLPAVWRSSRRPDPSREAAAETTGEDL